MFILTTISIILIVYMYTFKTEFKDDAGGLYIILVLIIIYSILMS